jgi:hypothetical protein
VHWCFLVVCVCVRECLEERLEEFMHRGDMGALMGMCVVCMCVLCVCVLCSCLCAHMCVCACVL